MQGVRQGGVLSPFLYCLFVNQLLDILSASRFGVSIDNIYCGVTMYAGSGGRFSRGVTGYARHCA